MVYQEPQQTGPLIQYCSLADFDTQSGSFAERIFFNYRHIVLLLCALLTVFLGYQATKLEVAASFEKMLPVDHPYIKNFKEHSKILSATTNTVRIIVATEKESIFDREYIETLRKINDEIYLYPGVDRAYMKSIWTSNAMWMAVTEEGLDGGTVMPMGFDGSPDSMAKLRVNIERSGEIGSLVAGDFKSCVILVPLLDRSGADGKLLDYADLNHKLELLREKYQPDGVQIYITGFAKIAGDLIDGIRQMLVFFLIAMLIASGVIFWYTRSYRCTIVIVVCSVTAVIWLLGLLPMLGFVLNPYSVLVPFLVFAIGMSHGAQKMNGVLQDIGRGTHKLVAARLTFRRLFIAGLTALLCDAVGFAVLMVIKIPVIQDLAVAASIGVAALVFTNLVLVPILLSYFGVNAKAAERSLRAEEQCLLPESEQCKQPIWAFLDLFTRPKWAVGAILVGIVMAVAGFVVSLDLKIGDLDPGAPEFRPKSRYNIDNAYMIEHYAASSDVYIVMVTTPIYKCAQYETLVKMEQLESKLMDLPGVATVLSFAGVARMNGMGYAEGNPKWYELSSNQGNLNLVAGRAPREFMNSSCDFLSIRAFLTDHKADTLSGVANTVDAFAAEFNTKDVNFLSAAGNAGIEAATNIMVKKANVQMMFLVYSAVIVFCFITFRSWRAVVCAILPLMLTSILCEALMVKLGIGVKVATLPVISLGVGIGVDYALYVLSILLARLREGRSLSDAYYRTLIFTGKIVILTGVTLAAGVATWFFSPIKFQADMGILLGFMFLWNMVGALIFLPALARLLLPPKYIMRHSGGKQPCTADPYGV